MATNGDSSVGADGLLAQVFRRSGTRWEPEATLTALGVSSGALYSTVAVDGDTIAQQAAMTIGTSSRRD